jgi:hypothetical protein
MMATIDVLQTMTEQRPSRNDPDFPLDLVLSSPTSRSLSQANADLIRPTRFTRVQISSPAGFGMFGVLKSVARGGIQVLTTISVPIRCPLEVTLEGCYPASGEAFYSIKRSSVCQVGIVFSARQKPCVAVGSVANIYDLQAPFTACRGSILDVGSTSLSILCKTAIPPGAWVRLESNGWILFGVVKDVVPTSMVSRCVEIHLEAGFAADLAYQEPEAETHFYRSFPQLPACVELDGKALLHGDKL